MKASLMRALLVLVALVVFSAACSESAPEEEGATTTDESDGGDDTDSTETTSDDEATGSDAGGAEGDSASDGDESGEDDSEANADGSTDDDGETADPGDSVIGEFAGEAWFRGSVPEAPVAADPSLEPVKIGMINMEESVAGSFPEVRAAAAAAIEFINTELGGVDGHPIEFFPCVTDFAVEASQACAQELVSEEVLAVVGGIDITSEGSVPVLIQNELPLVGGIPVGSIEMTSPVSFYFSGGGPGAFAGLAFHAVSESNATKVAVAYGDFGANAVAARDFGAAVVESQGAESELIPFPIVGLDFLPVFNKIAEFGADAIILGAGDTQCIPAMQVRQDLGMGDIPLYLTGACAADEIIAQADGLLDGVFFNTEGPIDVGNVEGEIYLAAVDQYAVEPAGGAGTVGFRGMMNLWDVLQEVGFDDLSTETVLANVKSSTDRPSFWGFDYTCSEDQLPGFPALCGPNQTVFQIATVDGELQATGVGPVEIDIPSLLGESG